MDWIRRNWLDLLIGFAFLAVILGIIITLFNGGSIFPSRNNDVDDNNTALAVGNANLVDSGVTAVTPVAPANIQGVQSIASNSTTSFTGTVATNVANTSAESATSSEAGVAPTIGIPLIGATRDNEQAAVEPASIAVTPLAPVNTAQANTLQGNSSSTPAPVSISASQPSAPFNVNVATTSSNTTTEAAPNTVNISRNDRSALLSNVASVPVNTTGVNRVSVGAFSDVNNANILANQLRAQGLPASTHLSAAGNLTFVYLGPYSNSSQAQQVASQLEASGVVTETQLYTQPLQPVAVQPVAVQPQPIAPQPIATQPIATQPIATQPIATQPIATQPIATQPIATQPVQPVTAQPVILTPNTNNAAPPLTSAGRYLQVGAYRDRATAAPQRQRLESLGYVVFDRVEDNLLKLIVGPYRSDELVNVQSILRAQGVDSFPTY